MNRTSQAGLMTTLLLGVSLMLVPGCGRKERQVGQAIHTYEQLNSRFADPPSEYRSTPLWDWNDKITEEGIDFQMEQFKAGGLGGVFVHPRPGLLTEYLSEDWHRLFEHTVRKGQELGMKVWIYDENSYPSGFAGGHVPAQMPDSYRHGTGLSCEVQETLAPDTSRYEIILKLEKNGFRDVTSELGKEKGKKGTYYLFKRTYSQKSYWYGNYPYVDLLYPGVTRKFTELTMKGYEAYNKPDFGQTLMGIFTDEPNLEAALGPNSLIRWTPDLYTEFQKRWGYDLKSNLPALIDEVGDWKKVRHDYYELILEMFLDRWAKPWNEYCEMNNLAWTGHYWEHGWPAPTEGIDEAAFYIYHQQPGVDMLGNELVPGGLGGQFGNTRAVRELASAANQASHIRTLSETYGGAGWEINFARFKRLVDWQGVLGVNFVNQHLSYYTIKGVRKFDYPPSFSYHEPWWGSYKPMGDYIGRISMAMASGKQVNRILVLQPNTTAWMFFSRKTRNAMVDSIQKSFKQFVYQLERDHVEYDLGSEHVLKMIGSVEKGKFVVGHRAYQLVVIPASIAGIDSSTVSLIKKYLEAGGKVLSFTREIPYLEGTKSSVPGELMEGYPSQWTFAEATDDPDIQDLLHQEDFTIDEPEPRQGELYFQRRILDDGQLVLLVNSDTLDHAGASITGTGRGLIRMDLASGKCYQVPVKPENGMITFSVDLPPVGSALYFMSGHKVNDPVEKEPGITGNAVSPKGQVTVKADAENVLVLNYMDVHSGKFDLKDVYFMKAMHMLYDSNGFAMGNPWQHKIQYKQDYLALDTFGTGSGFEVRYRFYVSESTDPAALRDLSAVVERPELWDVFLNGKKLDKSGSWWIDRDFYRFPLGDKLVKGINVLDLHAPKMSVHAELMPAYIVGNFVLKPSGKGFEIADGNLTQMGPWRSNGYPFYGHQVSYSQKFEIPDGHNVYKLKLNHWNGTLAEVFVNGNPAGQIMWPPYELDLEPVLKPGENEITVRITGSLKNTFGYFYKNNKQWINGPGDWDTAPEGNPPAGKYFLMNYGMFEPFSLVGMK